MTYVAVVCDNVYWRSERNRVKSTVTRPLIGACRNIYPVESYSWSDHR